MGLFDKVRKRAGGVADALRRADDYLEETAPSARRAAITAVSTAPGVGPILDIAGVKPKGVSGFDRAIGPITGPQALGRGLVREPVSHGIRRYILGEDRGSPFSGEEFKALEKKAKALPEGRERKAARAGLQALTEVTNPLTFLPIARAPGFVQSIKNPVVRMAVKRAVEDAPGFAGVGGFGGKTLASRAARAAGLGALGSAGSEYGGDIAEGAGLPRWAGTLGGGLVAPLAADVALSTAFARGLSPSSAGPGPAPTTSFGATPGGRAYIGKLHEILNDVINPAGNRPEASRAIAGQDGYHGNLREKEWAAAALGETARKDAAVVTRAIEDNAFTVSSAFRAKLSQAKNNAVGNDARVRLDEWATKLPVLLENRTDVRFRDVEAQKAFDELGNRFSEQEAREAKAGLDVAHVEGDYVPHKWEYDEKTSSAVRRGPLGAKQGFERARIYEDYMEGIAAGYTPATDDIGSLVTQRVLAGNVRILQKELGQQLNTLPGVILKRADVPEGAEYKSIRGAQLERVVPIHDKLAADAARAEYKAGRINQGTLDARLLDAENVVKSDWADALDAYFGPQTDFQSRGGKALIAITNIGRSLKLGFDLAMVGRLSPMAVAQVGLNPLKGGAWGGSLLYDAFSDSTVRWSKFRNETRVQDAARYIRNFPGPSEMGELFDIRGREGELEKGLFALGNKLGPAGVVPKLPVYMEEWQFQRFVPALMVNTFERLVGQMKKRHGSGMSDEEIKMIVGNRVGTLLSGVGPVWAGIGKDRMAKERLGILSPMWARGVLKNVADVGMLNEEGMLARQFWRNMTVMAVGISVLSGMLQARDFSKEKLQELLDPRSKDSVINPTSSRFLSIGVEGPVGGRAAIWGPAQPILRAILEPPAKGIGQANERIQELREKDELTGAGVMLGLGAFLEGTAEQVPASALRWGKGRMSIPFQQIHHAVTNQDWQGRTIRKAPDNKARFIEHVKYMGKQLVPGVAEEIFSDEYSAVPEGIGSRKAIIVGGISQALGAPIRLPSQDPKSIKAPVEDFLKARGIEPGNDPLGTFQSSEKLSTLDRSLFYEQQPNVREFLDKERIKKAENVPKARGKQAWTAYNGEATELRQQHDAELHAAGLKYRQDGMKGEDYASMRSDIEKKYIYGLKEAARVHLGANDQKEMQAIREELFGKPDNNTRFDQLIQEYYAIQPASPSQRDKAVWAAERSEFLSRLTLEDRRQFWQHKNVGEDETGKQYIEASSVLSQYYDIPTYTSVPPGWGRSVDSALARAKDTQALRGDEMPLSIILMQDTRLDPTTRSLAIMASYSPKNPEKKKFRDQHPEMRRFYISLFNDETDQILARRPRGSVT